MSRPGGLFPWALHECAPGRASGLQNRPTGFDSSHSCLPTWLETERRLSCKQVDAGANPVVGSLQKVNPDGVADCIGPSEGPGPGSNPGRDTERQFRPWSVLDARDRAKVVDQVRLLARTLERVQKRKGSGFSKEERDRVLSEP